MQNLMADIETKLKSDLYADNYSKLDKARNALASIREIATHYCFLSENLKEKALQEIEIQTVKALKEIL